jgi:hypothetical protein
LAISGTTIIRSRIVDGQLWSPIKETGFYAANEDYTNLKVTEVHYHPADLINGLDTVDGKDLEFIELKNTGNSSVNLSGVTIDTAVYYVVPDGVILPPKGFYVVASKPGEFYGYYGMNPSGNFRGNLSNAGEYVLITDKGGNQILSFTYSDDSPWPTTADGDGYSLVATTSLPAGDPNDYRYWKSSVRIGGSPFSDDETSTSAETVRDDQDRDKMIIYPNPVSDRFVIHVDGQVSGNMTLKLTDLTGNTALIRHVGNNSEISLSETGLPSGIYIVTAEYQGMVLRSMLVYLDRK